MTIIEGEAKADHVLKPAQTLSDVCLKGCTIRVNGSEDDEYRLTGGDAVSIEDGTVFYDPPDDLGGPASPAAAGKQGPQQRLRRQGAPVSVSFRGSCLSLAGPGRCAGRRLGLS